jgi:hypothetical protein
MPSPGLAAALPPTGVDRSSKARNRSPTSTAVSTNYHSKYSALRTSTPACPKARRADRWAALNLLRN